MNEHFDPELVIDFEEEDVLQNNMALMSRDFHIIPLEEVGNWKPATPQPSSAAPAVTTTAQEPKQEKQQQPKAEEPKKEPVTPAAPETVTAPSTQGSEPVYHTVKAGENLYRISVKYNTTVDNILKLNNLKNADRIVEGQKLRVK